MIHADPQDWTGTRRTWTSGAIAVMLLVFGEACRLDQPQSSPDDVFAKAELDEMRPPGTLEGVLAKSPTLPKEQDSLAKVLAKAGFNTNQEGALPDSDRDYRRRIPTAIAPQDTSDVDSKVRAGVVLDPTRWTELITLDASFAIDLRYATADNFVGEQMYACGRCYLRPVAAKSLVRVQDSLQTLGLGLKLYDCYRPLDVQWRLWRKVPDRRYVADPRKGSQHNRGVAVDLTIIDLSSGKELDMGTAYDYFGHEAWHAHTPKFGEPIRGNRERLRRLMRQFGWRETSSEWWHYSYPMARGTAPIEEREWICN